MRYEDENNPDSLKPDLAQFVAAQEGVYEQALSEIRRGRKQSHWMWYIIPKYDCLGFGSTSRHYDIKVCPRCRGILASPRPRTSSG